MYVLHKPPVRLPELQQTPVNFTDKPPENGEPLSKLTTQSTTLQRLSTQTVIVNKRRRFKMLEPRNRRNRSTEMIITQIKVSDIRRRRYRLRYRSFQIIMTQIHHHEVRSRPEHVWYVAFNSVSA
ncbi:hypothetical protein Hanom_Chr14g01313981 [Helianthus anomalus]